MIDPLSEKAKELADKILAARSPSMERGIFDAIYATLRAQAADVITREVLAALRDVQRESQATLRVGRAADERVKQS